MALNRTLCEVLEAMRKCNETRNYSYLTGLVEEAQNMGNKMEAGLYDKGDYESVRDERKKEEKKLKEIKEEIEKMKDERKGLTNSQKKEAKKQYKKETLNEQEKRAFYNRGELPSDTDSGLPELG